MKPWFVSVISSLMAVGCIPLGRGDGDDFDAPLPSTNAPDTRPVVSAALTPPPISGGTLLVSRDQRTAIASDPDHDVVWRVDLRTAPGTAESPVLSATALAPGDEPGRLVEDQRGWVHVVLRRGGGIATIDPARAQDVTRRAVCPEPRGIAYDVRTDVLHVACTNGDLVTFPAAGGREVRRVRLDDDLRDVVIRSRRQGDTLVVSRFRSAELLELGADGSIASRFVPPSRTASQSVVEDERAPGVAWRTITSGGQLHVVHQRMQTSVVGSQVSTAYYGGDDGFGCAADILESATSHVSGSTVVTSDFYAGAVLAVDLAVSRAGDQFAIASAGTRSVLVETPQILYEGAPTSCRGTQPITSYAMSELFDGDTLGRQPVAVAYRENEDGGEELLAQVRDPAAIVNLSTGRVTLLPGDVVSDSGHQTFHEAARVSGAEGTTGTDLACASCHPEGREDGRTWRFPDVGDRRTQSVAGGVLATAPFHWNGDREHLSAIMDDVFVFRMAGAVPSAPRVLAIGSWLDSIPAPQAGRHDDDDAIERGRTLFQDETVACATCHSGGRMTNNETVDVGTGGPFQVPSLVGVSARAPYLHDGRAGTLRDGFRSDDGRDHHGVTSGLSTEQIADLVAYLATL